MDDPTESARGAHSVSFSEKLFLKGAEMEITTKGCLSVELALPEIDVSFGLENGEVGEVHLRWNGYWPSELSPVHPRYPKIMLELPLDRTTPISVELVLRAEEAAILCETIRKGQPEAIRRGEQEQERWEREERSKGEVLADPLLTDGA
jgi:hypothetical protein